MSTDADNNADGSRHGASGTALRAAVSRRKFVKAAAAGAGALATSGRVGWAQSSETIKIGFITPRSGALGAFGETDAFVLDTARKLLADGISAGGKTYKIEILDRDTQSDPARAGQLAKSLINSDAPGSPRNSWRTNTRSSPCSWDCQSP
jgi:branched-chain amino acid transport system substrate-binding protein